MRTFQLGNKNCLRRLSIVVILICLVFLIGVAIKIMHNSKLVSQIDSTNDILEIIC